MSTRHVVIIVENLPVPFDRRVWMEAQSLKAAGYRVSVICPTGKGFDSTDETVSGVRILRHPLVEASSALDYLREYTVALWHEHRLLGVLSREGRIDAIQLCNPPDVLFLVTLWHKWIHGTRVIFDHHDINPELFEVKFGYRGPLHWLLRVAERLTFLIADVVISTNESYRDIAQTRGHVSRDRLFVVKSAPDLSTYCSPGANSRGRDACLVGYVGVMAEQDGLDILIESISDIRRQPDLRDVSFRLVGGGSELERLRNLVEARGLGDAVEFTGFLYGQDMIESLSECDIGVAPDPKNSYNDKCTMNKVLEYMALGLPVVQFDLVESRRSAGDAAVYAASHDHSGLAEAIASLCRDPELRTEMRRLGLERIAAQDWSIQVRQLLAAYDRAFRDSH